jgi:small conductance mechanosensitive channel
MNDVQDFFTTSKIDGWDVILAVLVVVVSIFLARAAKQATLRVLQRIKGVPSDPALVIANVVKYFVLLIGIGTALNFVGATVQPLTTAAIVAGVVAILLLRGIAGNFGAGLVLQTKGPFKPGDEVELMGYVGTVTELNGRAVVIETDAGDTIYFANGQVVSVPMINRSAKGVRRTELEVRAALTRPYDEIRETIRAAVCAAPQVLREPSPVLVTYRLDSSNVTLRVYFSHLPAQARTAPGNVIDAVGAALRAVDSESSIGPPTPLQRQVVEGDITSDDQ